MDISRLSPRLWLICGVLAAGLALTTLPSYAQDTGQGGYSLQESQATQDNTQDSNDADPDQSNAGPVRMARFAYLSGDVTWRADDTMDWSAAKTNLPLKQGAQITVGNGGRAEIQFDDGSYLRLGGGAVATLITLYSDTQGEFTEVKMTNGLGMLRLKNDHSVYQMDTPLVSVKATGPARIRLGLNDGVEIGVLNGQAVIDGAQGKVTMKSGDYLDLRDEKSAFDLRALPNPDSWERWNEDRDRSLDEAAASALRHQVPQNITLVAGDLDAYGTWNEDPVYGYVWCPRVTAVDWRPYCYGNWVWVDPFGWTWCSAEPWGWAPYHYGTWFHARYGWAWRPGPAHQYWCPAVVHFSERNGEIAWCPLAPGEVRYPANLGIGFRGGDWAAFFSIGVAGCYYPSFGRTGFFVGRSWSNLYVNHVTNVNNINGVDRFHNGTEFATNHNTYLENRNYVPINARAAGGATVASQSAFAGREPYRPVPAGITAPFSQGHAIGAPTTGQAPVVGPPTVHPTVASLTPNRTFVRSASETPSINNRPVYRSPVSPDIARTSSSFGSRAAAASAGQGTANTGNSTASHSLTQSGNRAGNTNSATNAARSTSGTTTGSTHALSAASGGESSTGATHSAAADAAARARASIGWTGGHSPSGNSTGGTMGRSDGSSSTSGSRTGGFGSYGSRSYDGSSSSGRSYGSGSSTGSPYGSNGNRSYDGSSSSSRTYGGGASSSSPYNGGVPGYHSTESGSSSGRSYGGSNSSTGGAASGGARSGGGGSSGGAASGGGSSRTGGH